MTLLVTPLGGELGREVGILLVTSSLGMLLGVSLGESLGVALGVLLGFSLGVSLGVSLGISLSVSFSKTRAMVGFDEARDILRFFPAFVDHLHREPSLDLCRSLAMDSTSNIT